MLSKKFRNEVNCSLTSLKTRPWRASRVSIRRQEAIGGAAKGIHGSGRGLPRFPTPRKSALFPPIVRLTSRKIIEAWVEQKR